MKAVRTQTAGKLARVERMANRDAIERRTRAAPELVASALSKDPTLLNAYAEADVLIDILFETGMTKALETIHANGQCSQRIRRLIATKLMFH